MEEKYILSDRGKVYYWIKESNSVFAKNLIFFARTNSKSSSF